MSSPLYQKEICPLLQGVCMFCNMLMEYRLLLPGWMQHLLRGPLHVLSQLELVARLATSFMMNISGFWSASFSCDIGETVTAAPTVMPMDATVRAQEVFSAQAFLNILCLPQGLPQLDVRREHHLQHTVALLSCHTVL